MIPLRPKAGFTILEVMVAIMILSVSVVSMFGAQFAAIATVDFAKNTTQAVGLARCRMSEIELQIQINNGFEEADVVSSGDCCEMLEGEPGIKDFTCSWEIKSIELPDLSSALTGGGADGGTGLLGDFGLDQMDNGTGGGGGGDSMDMIASFVPMLSDLLKQAVRRVTVKVEWNQGSKRKEFVLAQYLTHPTQGPLEMMHNMMSTMDMAESAEERGMLPLMPGQNSSESTADRFRSDSP